MSDNKVNKRYEPSKNLCKRFRIKNPNFCTDVTISGDIKFFCSDCRKLYSVSAKGHCVCPVCNKKSASLRHMFHFTFPQQMYRCKNAIAMVQDVIDNVTINKSWQGSELKDENVTILYRDYLWSDDFKVQQSFTKYHRMIVSFENKQLYFTGKATGNKHVHFEHYKPWTGVIGYYDSVYNQFNRYVKYMVNEVYSNYGLESIYANKMYGSCKNLSTVGFLYNCLKFPIAFKYVMALGEACGDNYGVRSKSRPLINMMAYWLYIASKSESFLLHTLCATDEDTYFNNIRQICDKFDNPDALFDFCVTYPLGIVFAQNLHHYGFTQSQSVVKLVMRMVNDSSNRCLPVWLYELLSKRNHAQRKFWKRMLTKIYEADLIDMIVNSNICCDSAVYHYQCYDVITYYDIQEFYDNVIPYLSDKSMSVGTLDGLLQTFVDKQ